MEIMGNRGKLSVAYGKEATTNHLPATREESGSKRYLRTSQIWRKADGRWRPFTDDS
ncbi:hypothetical protein J6590_041107 [Homalodisca vitripennis]|nr:hypothetical protein J6590_041107 [Homalodisca vitripennis]